jgi:transcription initiation factor TFIID subunit 5
VWDVERRVPVRCMAQHSGNIFALAVSPDGRLVACGGADRNVCVRDAASGARMQIMPVCSDTLPAVLEYA